MSQNPLGTLNAGNAFTGSSTACLPRSPICRPAALQSHAQHASVWVNQNFLSLPASSALGASLWISHGANFKYGYSNQATSASSTSSATTGRSTCPYNFNGGRRLNRPINANTANGNLIVQNWYNAMTDPNVAGAAFANNPLTVDTAGVNLAAWRPNAETRHAAPTSRRPGQLLPPSGFNPTLAVLAPAPQLNALAGKAVLSYYGLAWAVSPVQRPGGQLLQRHL